MAGVIKRNPLVATDAWEVIGKKITWFDVTATAIPVEDGTGSEYQVGWESDGALNAVVAVIQKTTTIIAMGPVRAGGAFSIGVEGIFTAQDNFDGTALDGDLARMLADIRALGTVKGNDAAGQPNGAGVDVSSTVIIPSTFVLAPTGPAIT